MWSVTLRLLWFLAFFHDFTQIECVGRTLFRKATDYISTNRAQHVSLLIACVLLTTRKQNASN